MTPIPEASTLILYILTHMVCIRCFCGDRGTRSKNLQFSTAESAETTEFLDVFNPCLDFVPFREAGKGFYWKPSILMNIIYIFQCSFIIHRVMI